MPSAFLFYRAEEGGEWRRVREAESALFLLLEREREREREERRALR